MVTVELNVLHVPNVDEWQTQLRAALVGSLAAVGAVLVEATDSCFELQQDPWGNPWPATQRSARGEGRILIDRGILRGSIHVEMDETTLTVRVAVGGAASSYAFVHQWGSETKGIVPRPFLALRGSSAAPVVDLPPDVLAEVTATIQDAMDQFAARANATR